MKYLNLKGKSNIIKYNYGEDFINVQFRNGIIYKYTYDGTVRQLLKI